MGGPPRRVELAGALHGCGLNEVQKRITLSATLTDHLQETEAQGRGEGWATPGLVAAGPQSSEGGL